MKKGVIALLIAALMCLAGCTDFTPDNNISKNQDDNKTTDITSYSTPSLAITPEIVYNLEEVYTKFGTDLPVPSYMSEGYVFQYAIHYGEPDNRTSLIYNSTNGDEIRITQVPLPANPCPEPVPGEITEVVINGTTGNFTAGETKNKLQWCDEQYSYCLTGMIGEDEMVTVASSIG